MRINDTRADSGSSTEWALPHVKPVVVAAPHHDDPKEEVDGDTGSSTEFTDPVTTTSPSVGEEDKDGEHHERLVEQEPAFQAAALVNHDEQVMARNETMETTPLPPMVEELPPKTLPSPPRSTSAKTAWRARLHQRLYQRSHEEALLHRAFESSRVNPNELILITGASGMGKTRLAKAMCRLAFEEDGYFILGKFDQLRQAAPYTAFVHAFADFTNQVLHRGDEEAERMRHAIQDAIGTETSVLTGMLPALEQIVGSSPSDQQQGPANNGGALQRFVFVIRMFIRSLCSPERPLVLVLDDLQYADMCSLDLLYSIASDPRIQGLVLVATCDDAVQPDSYLASRLRDLEDRTDSKITNIQLSPFSQSDIYFVIRDSLLLDEHDCEVLSALVHLQTQGNTLYVIEYLKWMQESEVLEWDGPTEQWMLDKDEVNSMMEKKCCEKCDFMLNMLRELPKPHQEVLKVSA